MTGAALTLRSACSVAALAFAATALAQQTAPIAAPAAASASPSATMAPAGTAVVTPPGTAAAPLTPAATITPAANATAKTTVAPAPAKNAKADAAKASAKLAWGDLTPPQQHALQPLAGKWDTLEKIRQQKWLDVAKLFSKMTPDEQRRVQDRMRDWVALTPDQRNLARENYARSKKIEASQKSAQWERYQQLPEEQKKKLAADNAVKKQVAALPSQSQWKSAPAKPRASPPATATVATNAAPASAPAMAPPAGAAPNATSAAANVK